jgi:hypothetical protein
LTPCCRETTLGAASRLGSTKFRARNTGMDVNRLLDDLCQALDPIKRNGLRTLVQELTAQKAARKIPSVTKALLVWAPAVVGADLWRECCEKQRPRRDPVPGPAAADGDEDASPPPTRRPWRCKWCQTPTSRQQCRGPHGPNTLCETCNGRWRRGETGPRSDEWECDWCGVEETTRRFKGPKGPGTLCGKCGTSHAKGATGPQAKNWCCDWCETSETRWRATGPKGRETLCEPCGDRFRNGKTGPLSAAFECRWCGATSTSNRRAGPTCEGELCNSCGNSYAKMAPKAKARLVHVEKELDRLTSVSVINAETGAETRERPPKRARDDEAAPTSGLKALMTMTDATTGQFAEVKRENAALEGQRDRIDATAAEASAAAASANADAATANDDAEEAHDTLGYQIRFTDALQTKIDELHALARQVDPVAADAIKNRQAT